MCMLQMGDMLHINKFTNSILFPANIDIPNQNPDGIFTNNELSLSNIEVYGFDYDYTLATYTRDLHNLIFQLSKESLVNNLKVRHISVS